MFTSFDKAADNLGIVRVFASRHTARICYIVIQFQHKLRRDLVTCRFLAVTPDTKDL